MNIPTEAELIEIEQRARRLADELDDWEVDEISDDVQSLIALVRELRPCQ